MTTNQYVWLICHFVIRLHNLQYLWDSISFIKYEHILVPLSFLLFANTFFFFFKQKQSLWFISDIISFIHGFKQFTAYIYLYIYIYIYIQPVCIKYCCMCFFSLSVSGYKLDRSYKYVGHPWNKVSDTHLSHHTSSNHIGVDKRAFEVLSHDLFCILRWHK